MSDKDSKGELKPYPPLTSKWRYAKNYLFCGTLRIARWDIDTVPSQEFKDKLGEWMAQQLNTRPITPNEEWISVEEWMGVLKGNLIGAGLCQFCGARETHKENECPHLPVVLKLEKK